MRISELLRQGQKRQGDSNKHTLGLISDDLEMQTRNEQQAIQKAVKAIHKAQADIFKQYTDNLDPKDKTSIGKELEGGALAAYLLEKVIKPSYPRVKITLK